jgi:hypothetical protein
MGAQGATGAEGPTGSINVSALTKVVGPTGQVGTEKGHTVGSALAECPAGSRAVSGGGSSTIATLVDTEMENSHQTWFIIVFNQESIPVNIHASVECAAAGQAVAARLPRTSHPLMDKRLAEVRAEVERLAGAPK